ncbi:MAG TPA: hypothetical protein PKE63_06725, partial [Lacibacter sp.]|nr:hypothetical protein [Lacibacter sp.]
YLMAAGGLGHLLQLDAATLLNLLSLLNLLLFFAAVGILARLFLPPGPPGRSFTLLLVTLLVCWGGDPPFFSSFFHLRAFPYSLGYPSTFSFVGAVLAAGLFQQLISRPGRKWQKGALSLLLLLTGSVVLLTHPLTFLFLGSLLFAAGLQTKIPLRQWLPWLAAVLVLPFVVAGLWPWYPFYSLLGYAGAGHQFHSDSRALYSNIYLELYPLALPLILLLLNGKPGVRRHLPLLLAALPLALLFFYGYFTGAYGWGRMVAFLAVLGQLVFLRETLHRYQQRPSFILPAAALLLCLPYALPALATNYRTSVTPVVTCKALPGEPFGLLPPACVAHRLGSISHYIGYGDLVLADSTCNRYLPGYGARVVASVFPAYWITDNDARREELRQFFAPEGDSSREGLIRRITPRWVVLTPDHHTIRQQLDTLAFLQLTADTAGIRLYRVLQ